MRYNWNILEVFLQLSVPTLACDEHTVHIICAHLWIRVVHKSMWCKSLSPTVAEFMFLHSTKACEQMQTRTFLLLDNF